MPGYYDDLETRHSDERADWLEDALPAALGRAKTAPALARLLRDVDSGAVRDRAALAKLPVIRPADLAEAQRKNPPFGGFTTRLAQEFDHIFQSRALLYEPGRREGDWWRLGRFLFACGIGRGDIVQNCFSYHLSPAGMMFDSAARAVDATVLPAGDAPMELQLRAAADIGATVFAGPPGFLRALLDAAEAAGAALTITRAVTAGAPLDAELRARCAALGIAAREAYATADLGSIAYESEAMQGLIVDEGVIVEILDPQTGKLLPEGAVGEVVVTTLNPDYPLIRLATGDLSAVLPGPSPCGRTNMRLKGLLGRV